MLRYENKDVREIHSGAHRIENNANTELGAYTAEPSKETEAWSEKELEHINVLRTLQHELSDRELSTYTYYKIVLTSWGVITE
jgi:hypothetical protein